MCILKQGGESSCLSTKPHDVGSGGHSPPQPRAPCRSLGAFVVVLLPKVSPVASLWPTSLINKASENKFCMPAELPFSGLGNLLVLIQGIEGRLERQHVAASPATAGPGLLARRYTCLTSSPKIHSLLFSLIFPDIQNPAFIFHLSFKTNHKQD